MGKPQPRGGFFRVLYKSGHFAQIIPDFQGIILTNSIPARTWQRLLSENNDFTFKKRSLKPSWIILGGVRLCSIRKASGDYRIGQTFLLFEAHNYWDWIRGKRRRLGTNNSKKTKYQRFGRGRGRPWVRVPSWLQPFSGFPSKAACEFWSN